MRAMWESLTPPFRVFLVVLVVLELLVLVIQFWGTF